MAMKWVRVGPGRLRQVDDSKPKQRKSGHYILPDIEPYKAVAGDMAGKMITSRSQHRAFLKRNGFEEVGNEHREFFEYGGKCRDHQFAKRNDGYDSIRAELAGATGRRTSSRN